MVMEKTVESPLDCKEIQPVHPIWDQSWVFIGRTDAEAETPILWPPHVSEELTHWKRPWCWEGLGAGGEGDDWGWDGWMASPTWWIWVWVNSGSLWWTGRPGVLRFMGSERVGTTEQQNWTDGANSKKIKEQANRRVWGTPDKGISSTEAPRWHQWQQSNLEKMTTCSAAVYLASSLRPVWVEERKWRDRMQVDKEEMGRENTWSLRGHSKDFDLPCLWNRKLWEGFEQQNEIN